MVVYVKQMGSANSDDLRCCDGRHECGVGLWMWRHDQVLSSGERNTDEAMDPHINPGR
jgi:hypothetical protein